ncbi:MAG: bifunctional 4-hydroxy-2-oxoglutarate aldolase/2-dehydro-3-deoxy-phosphogluconate aldolase [Synechocystis sp.]|nr:bifunctional 4-hydroxy-2-oxoglutarate aldolase/2-dehydro-3-deoxy-phosphogluconate aldolase [Synechocystis sp.]
MAALRSPWLDLLREQRIIAVVRTASLSLSLHLAQLAIDAGIRLIEITWNSAQAGEAIAQLRRQCPHCWIGTGTVLTLNDLQGAINYGSQFCFTPHCDLALIHQAIAAQIPIIPGAFSPTEIVQAWQGGASAVKVFPISSLGGVEYLQALQGPLGHIPLIPTGGITLDTAPTLIQAGAIAVGLAGQLFPPTLIQRQDWPMIKQRLMEFVTVMKSCS